MLSRVAERIYWAARYLERVENTARLVSVYANLMLDLPAGVDISWYNLVELNSNQELFNERYKNRDERNVVKFMLADEYNFSSMTSSLKMVRENLRTSRDVIPPDAWELINELNIYVRENIQSGINRGQRHDFLTHVIRGCQQINGLLSGTMSQDAPWEFLRLGRNLERADMTTRILDAGSSMLVANNEKLADPVVQIVWGHVLGSLSALLPYRRTARRAVSGSEVAYFLLEDPHFPRTVAFCLDHMIQGAGSLPRQDAVVKQLQKIRKTAFTDFDYNQLGLPFRDAINDLQLKIGSLHTCFADTWFALK